MPDIGDVRRVYLSAITPAPQQPGTKASSSFTRVLASELSGDSAFDKAVSYVLKNNTRYVPGENPMKYGIMQSTLKDYDPKGTIAKDVNELDEAKARQMYRKVWDRAGCDKLSYPLSVIHFDTYVQRPRTGQRALKQANGDPQAYLEVRKSLESNLKGYSANRAYFRSRLDQLAAYVKVSDSSMASATQATEKQVAAPRAEAVRPPAKDAGGSVFDTAMSFILSQEGSKLVPNDNGRGPSRYGILQTTLKDYDPKGTIATKVSELDEAKAKRIYHKIWDRAGCTELPFPLSVIHFDTYLHRPNTAVQALKTADGDPEAYLQARQTSLKNLRSYSKFGVNWENRISKLMQFVVRSLDKPDTRPGGSS
jgi:lysozyme family protein